ncbi:MAG TPA: class II aldolase/adducin family protein [Alphaproteobacteria bacterium]
MDGRINETTEERLKTAVAATTVVLSHAGILGYSGHVSLRLPDRPDAFLIQPVDDSRAALQPEAVLTVDRDGKAIAGRAGAKPPREVFIHSEIFRARPDVNAVLHYHPALATLFTMVEGRELVPLRNQAARWMSGIPVYPDPGHVNSPAKGRALAAALGPHNAALIRAHGAVLVAEGLKELFIDAVHFEENAEAVYRAAPLGPLKPLAREELAAFAKQIDRAAHGAKLWTYYAGRAAADGAIPHAWTRI